MAHSSNQSNAMHYSGTSIIWTSFIQHLDYPDLLNSAKYINTHVQRAKLADLCSCMNAVDRDYTIEQLRVTSSPIETNTKFTSAWQDCTNVRHSRTIVTTLLEFLDASPLGLYYRYASS